MNRFIAILFTRLVALFFWLSLLLNVGYAIFIVLQGGNILFGVASVVGGVLLTALIFGTLALLIENNKLLTELVEQGRVNAGSRLYRDAEATKRSASNTAPRIEPKLTNR